MKRHHRRFFFLTIILGIVLGAFGGPAYAITEMKGGYPDDKLDSVGGGGMTFKYKSVEGPMGFGGDMLMYGLRGFLGKTGNTKFGLCASTGVLNGRSLKLNVKMGGFTFEDRLLTDKNLQWRLTIGGGSFSFTSQVSGHVFDDGTFAYFEPMIFGIIPMNRHFRLEIGAGYTLTNTQGVRIEGPCAQVELLVGRY